MILCFVHSNWQVQFHCQPQSQGIVAPCVFSFPLTAKAYQIQKKFQSYIKLPTYRWSNSFDTDCRTLMLFWDWQLYLYKIISIIIAKIHHSWISKTPNICADVSKLFVLVLYYLQLFITFLPLIVKLRSDDQRAMPFTDSPTSTHWWMSSVLQMRPQPNFPSLT